MDKHYTSLVTQATPADTHLPNLPQYATNDMHLDNKEVYSVCRVIRASADDIEMCLSHYMFMETAFQALEDS